MAVGIPEVARRYITRCSANDDPTDGEVSLGFTPVEVAGAKCYTNGKQAEGDIGYGEGIKLTQEVGGRTIYRAGGAIACGPLHVITQVTGPQTSYTAELQSFAVNWGLASTNQELIYDNKGVVDRALHPPHRPRPKPRKSEHKSNVTMRSTVLPKWQLSYLSLNTRLPTQVTSLSMGVLCLHQPKNGS